MSNEILQSRIELLEEQIENLQHSGHFTELEIDRKLHLLNSELFHTKSHLDLLNACDFATKSINNFVESANLFGKLHIVYSDEEKQNLSKINVFKVI